MSVKFGREVYRFLLAGLLNTGLTYAIYLLLLPFTGYFWAFSIAYVAGIFVSYALNTGFVFRVRRSLRGAALYPLVYVVQYLVGLAALDAAIRYLGMPKPLAPLASIIVTVPVTFFLTRTLLRSTSPSTRTVTCDRVDDQTNSS